jgi:hypothetical protein
MQQNQILAAKKEEEAERLKREKMSNEDIIRMQKDQEFMKNSNVKEMIRQQKTIAEERKHMVSLI